MKNGAQRKSSEKRSQWYVINATSFALQLHPYNNYIDKIKMSMHSEQHTVQFKPNSILIWLASLSSMCCTATRFTTCASVFWLNFICKNNLLKIKFQLNSGCDLISCKFNVSSTAACWFYCNFKYCLNNLIEILQSVSHLRMIARSESLTKRSSSKFQIYIYIFIVWTLKEFTQNNERYFIFGQRKGILLKNSYVHRRYRRNPSEFMKQ